MSPDKELYHFDYHRLDSFLKDDCHPEELGRALDEIMADLVSYNGKEDSYYQFLKTRYYVLRELRDIFLTLKQS